MNKPIVTGYYRFTDINFEWHQVFPNASDRSALKAFIAPDSLTHPDNPLNAHKGSKEPGVTLTMGTLESGESRLLFSSHQVEYIRYWLHAIGLTTSLLPLPSSAYLLTESSLKTASPVTYTSSGQLRAALKNISKNNKRLKGTDHALHSLRSMFERVRTCWSEKKGTWLAVDFEAWEMEHQLMTEYGWSAVTWQDDKEETETGHCIIEERMKYRNSTFLPNNRDYFLFGESQIMKLSALKKLVQDQISAFSSSGPLYLVFHSYNNDIEYLKSLNAPIDDLQKMLPELSPDSGIYLVDTSKMFSALEGFAGEQRGLSRMCALLGISDLDRFHNAGNDAHFTMLALRSMASGAPVDLQREARWPSQTELNSRGGKSVRVDWAPHQIDSDYDDMEGIFPPQATAANDHDDDST